MSMRPRPTSRTASARPAWASSSDPSRETRRSSCTGSSTRCGHRRTTPRCADGPSTSCWRAPSIVKSTSASAGGAVSRRPAGFARVDDDNAVLLDNLPLLRFLPDDLRKLVRDSFTRLEVAFGNAIATEGGEADAFYVVV